MPTLLVSAGELAAHPEWLIFDCRHDLSNPGAGQAAYAQGHIPGALHLHLDRDMSGPTTGRNGRHPLPNAEAFATRMSACGVGAQTQVVAYDSQGGIYAARLWWLLRWLGHELVAVIDGGLAAWQREGRALETAAPEVQPAAGSNSKSRGGALDVDDVLANLETQALLVVDARSAERFAGRNETLDPVGGHIPGAANRFYQNNLDPVSGCFKSAAVLRIEFDSLLAGRDPASVVHQCGSGVTACHNLLAMEIAGLGGSLLYPGSWSEWCADPSRPIATAAI